MSSTTNDLCLIAACWPSSAAEPFLSRLCCPRKFLSSNGFLFSISIFMHSFFVLVRVRCCVVKGNSEIEWRVFVIVRFRLWFSIRSNARREKNVNVKRLKASGRMRAPEPRGHTADCTRRKRERERVFLIRLKFMNLMKM